VTTARLVTNVQERLALAEWLGDTPLTVISQHLLLRGNCSAYVCGSGPDALVVQFDDCPTEPAAFGDDPEAMWAALRLAEGWECVNVGEDCTPALAAIVTRELGGESRLYGDLYFTLTEAPRQHPRPAARLLTPEDLPLAERVNGFETVTS